jgi:hypothetical protein
MKVRLRQIVKWALWGLAVAAVLSGLYLSVFFFPYSFFPHHLEHAGFSVYFDREIPEKYELILEDARRRVEAMELYHGDPDLRIFVCGSQKLFAALNKLAGKRHIGQALVISVAGNAFFSPAVIEAVGQRHVGRPKYSRLQGSWAAAIAHEVAHDLVFAEVGYREARRIPVWKAEGYADYQANFAASSSDPDYDLRKRIAYLLDDDNWRPPATAVDRRHFRWHLLVEYLCSVRGLAFADLLAEGVTEDGARTEMMEWYSLPEPHALPNSEFGIRN